MTFVGLAPAWVAGLIAAGCVVLFVLYLLRLRRRRVEVAFAPLWTRVLVERDSTNLFRRLKRWLSLLVQVALLAFLVLALGDPRLGRVLEGRDVVVVIDASASMKATDVAPSRMARARAEAKRVVRGLSGADSVLVLRMDATPRPLGPWDVDVTAAARRIDGVMASDTAADLSRALDLAVDALRGRRHPTVVLVGDGDWPAEPLAAPRLAQVDLRFVPIGSRGDNLAVTAFAGRRRPADRRRFDLFMEVRSFRAVATEVTVEVRADGVLVDRRAMTIGPGEAVRRTYQDFGGRGGLFEARLVAPPDADCLAADDRAFALVPERRRRRTLLVTDGNLFLEGALLADPDVSLERIPPAGYRPREATGFDVAIFDRVAPEPPPGVRGVLLVDPQGGGAFAVVRRVVDPILTDVARDHPVARGVVLRDVNIRDASAFAVGPSDTTVASSFGAPVIVARADAGVRTVAVGFDVRGSDLPLRAAFPILLANALDWFVDDEADGPLLVTGSAWRVPVDSAGPIDVTAPSGRRFAAPVVDGRAVVWADEIGPWTVGKLTVAASLGAPAESRIAPRHPAGAGGVALPAPELRDTGLRRDVWIYLAVLALVVALVEWFTYQRRITV